jgi:hypothetical protein
LLEDGRHGQDGRPRRSHGDGREPRRSLVVALPSWSVRQKQGVQRLPRGEPRKGYWPGLNGESISSSSGAVDVGSYLTESSSTIATKGVCVASA